MFDVHPPHVRSKNMAAIKSSDTRLELLIRKSLHKKGYRYTLNNSKLPGKPDIVLPKHNAALFIHGCFWHCHECALFKWPKTKREFWHEKLTKNKKNDAKNQNELNLQGWRIGIIWECSVRGSCRIPQERLVEIIILWLESEQRRFEVQGTTSI